MTDRADRALAVAIDFLEQRKAERVVVLDLRGRSTLCDHFVICHGTSDRQIKSLAEGVEKAVRDETGLRPRIEGRGSSEWVLLDYGDFVVHIFSEESRQVFRLESLWYELTRDETPEGGAEAAGDEAAP